MSLIKPLLIIFILFVFFKYVFKNKSALATRIVSISILFVVTFFVVFPELSTSIANYLGVGRGVDMSIYLFICLATILFFRMYSKTKDLDQQITKIVRNIAIDNAGYKTSGKASQAR